MAGWAAREGGVWAPRPRGTVCSPLLLVSAEPQFLLRCNYLGPFFIPTFKALKLSWYTGALRAPVKAFSTQLNAACGIIVLSET